MKQRPNFWQRVVATTLLFTLALLSSDLVLAANETDGFSRTFRWKYGGTWHEMAYEFPWDTYSFYQEKPRVYHNYAVYAHENPKYPYLADFTTQLECKAKDLGLSEWETIRFFTAFVQYLSYVNEMGEYPKFPIETLAEKGGDCEDSSILLAAMLKELGYDPLLINPPGHMAIALACRDCDGLSYSRNGRQYYYIETTGPGFDVGEIPPEYRHTKDKIYSMKVEPLDLWVLHDFIPRRQAGDRMYSVNEDADTQMSDAKNGETLVTQTRLRTVMVGGQRSTNKTVLKWFE